MAKANYAAGKARIRRAHKALDQLYKAQLASMTSEEFREYSRRVLGSVSPDEAARDMREFGFTDDMVESALKYIYDDEGDGDGDNAKGEAANAR